MQKLNSLSPVDIRAMRDDMPKLRERDFADKLGISEGQLISAYCSVEVNKQCVSTQSVRIKSHPDKVIKAAETLGSVMALTRNISCVNEKVGVYENYHSGSHAAMVLTEAIDLRLFPSQWKHAFMVSKETDAGMRRSLQVFDAAGDAVHKIFMTDKSNSDAWKSVSVALSTEDQGQSIDVVKRAPVEGPKYNDAKLDILRKEWGRMTDTHQFMRLTSKLRMNRLGAYRTVGAPFVRKLERSTVDEMLKHVHQAGIEIMLFTGNKGCIQIHTGPLKTLKPMGPWQNVMDFGFNLHLRLDHIAEVWAVEKPTQRGPAVSVEAFDEHGGLILQVFGVSKEGRDSRPGWQKIIDALEDYIE